MGKTFYYWQDLYDNGIIENHMINLQLAHLKYAITQNYITNKEYYEHHIRITENFVKSSSTYKPCVLMDFGKAFKRQKSQNGQKKIIINLFSENTQKYLVDAHKTTNHRNETILKNKQDYLNKKQVLNKRSTDVIKKKLKKKRRCYNNCENININDNCMKTKIMYDNDDVHYYEGDENSLKQCCPPKNLVKIFVRLTNKIHISNTESKDSLIAKQKYARDVFRNILKQLKKEKKMRHTI